MSKAIDVLADIEAILNADNPTDTLREKIEQLAEPQPVAVDEKVKPEVMPEHEEIDAVYGAVSNDGCYFGDEDDVVTIFHAPEPNEAAFLKPEPVETEPKKVVITADIKDPDPETVELILEDNLRTQAMKLGECIFSDGSKTRERVYRANAFELVRENEELADYIDQQMAKLKFQPIIGKKFGLVREEVSELDFLYEVLGYITMYRIEDHKNENKNAVIKAICRLEKAKVDYEEVWGDEALASFAANQKAAREGRTSVEETSYDDLRSQYMTEMALWDRQQLIDTRDSMTELYASQDKARYEAIELLLRAIDDAGGEQTEPDTEIFVEEPVEATAPVEEKEKSGYVDRLIAYIRQLRTQEPKAPKSEQNRVNTVATVGIILVIICGVISVSYASHAKTQYVEGYVQGAQEQREIITNVLEENGIVLNWD